MSPARPRLDDSPAFAPFRGRRRIDRANGLLVSLTSADVRRPTREGDLAGPARMPCENVHSPLCDEAPISQVTARDCEVFPAFYDRYAGRLLRLIMTLIRQRSAAEDVLQDTRLEAWTRRAAR